MEPIVQRWAVDDLPIYDTAAGRALWWTELVELWRYRDLVVQLVSRDIKVRYKRSVLGVAWTMLNPLLMMLVLTVAFSQIFRIESPNYPVFLLSATLAWNFFSQTSTVAVHQLLGGSALLTRIYVPRTVFAVAATLVGLVNLLMSLAPLLLIMLVTQAPFSLALLWLPLSMLILAAFTLGLSLILSTLVIRFHDVVDIYQVVLSAWFFLTPIVYPPSLASGQQAWQITANPMFYLISLFREPIYEGHAPENFLLLVAALGSTLTLIIGWVLFTSRSDELAYRL